MQARALRWTGLASGIAANAGSLVGTTAVTSALGYLFWVVAAHRFAAEDVGLAAAATSASLLLGTLGMMGFGTLLIGELPRQQGNEWSVISAAFLVAAAAGGAFGLLFALLAPLVSPNFQALGASVAVVILIAAGVSLTAATLVLDQALIGLTRGDLQLGRNTIFAAAKLAALILAAPLLANKSWLVLYATWIVGNLVSIAGLAGIVTRSGMHRRHYFPQWRLLRGMGGSAMSHHALNLALQLPSAALPLLVTVILSAQTNAYLYTAWMVAGFVFVGPIALATALYASGRRDASLLSRRIRFTLALAMLTGLLANVALAVGAERVLALFGSSYAAQGAVALRIFGLAVFPLIVKDHFVTVCRIQERIGRASAIVAAGGMFELVLAAFGASVGGLVGVSVGYAVALYVEGVLMSPTVLRAAVASSLDGRAGAH